MTVALSGENYIRNGSISLYIAVGICTYRKTSGWSVRFDLNGELVIITLHHDAHHCSCGKGSSESGAHDGTCVVKSSGLLTHIPGGAGKCPYVIISGCSSYYIIF